MTLREFNQSIISEVCAEHGVSLALVMGRRRDASIARARQCCYRELRIRGASSLGGLTAKQIGKIFGRDHSTILHGIKAVSE